MRRLRLFLASVGFRTFTFPLVTPPMGLMALAAYLRERFAVDVRLVNQRLNNCSTEELARDAIAFDADVVGFSALATSAYLLPELTRKVRAGLPKVLVLLGGPYATSAAGQALTVTSADVAVPGEGELTTEAVLRAHLEGADFTGIPSLVWRDSEGSIRTNPGSPPMIEDLDSLPMPAYDLVDLPAYWRRQSIAPIVRRQYAPLVSSRGCPYRCMWCHNIFGKRVRMHSAERIVEEIAYCQRTYGVEDFEFLDDIFNFDRDRTLEFCDRLHRRNLRVKLAFPTALRGDILTEEMVHALTDAGMYFCGFSLETGSPRLQRYTCKQLNIPNFLKGVEMTAARRVYVQGFCMMGFPTETEAELQQTIDVACGSQFHSASFFTVTPFPGTPLYERARELCPAKIENIQYNDHDFSSMRVNLTDLPDEVLYAYQRRAMRQFYSSPRRIARILRDYPQPLALPAYIPIFLYRSTKGLWTRSRKRDPGPDTRR